jgi:hypothetical protein
MLPIKFADPSRLYSSGDLKAQLRLVVTNGSPSNSHGAHPPQQAVHEGNPFLNSYPDGERTSALTKVVGYLLSKDLPVETVRQMALDWNDRQSPPLDVGKVHSTVESLAKADMRNHPERHKGPLTPLFDIADANIDLLLRTSPPARRWLLSDMLPLGIVGMIVAPGGTGIRPASRGPACDGFLPTDRGVPSPPDRLRLCRSPLAASVPRIPPWPVRRW